jgi:hypothetical protein
MFSTEQLALLVGVLSPLVGVPLAVITLYLKAIRENQRATTAEFSDRIGGIELSVRDVLRCVVDFEREYATKEEWVREAMIARQRLEQLTEIVTRIEVELENGRGIAAELGRTASAIAGLAERAVVANQN